MLDNLVGRFKQLNTLETLVLWFIISAVVLPLVGILAAKMFGSNIGIIVSLLIGLVIVVGRFYNMQVKSFIGVLTFCVAAGALFFQSQILSVQTEALFLQSKVLEASSKQNQLNTRPQLVVNIHPRFWNSGETSFFGGNVTLENYSNFPARNVEFQFHLDSDAGPIDDPKPAKIRTFPKVPGLIA